MTPIDIDDLEADEEAIVIAAAATVFVNLVVTEGPIDRRRQLGPRIRAVINPLRRCYMQIASLAAQIRPSNISFVCPFRSSTTSAVGCV